MDLEKRIANLEQKLKETKEKAAKKAAAQKAQNQAALKASTQRRQALAGRISTGWCVQYWCAHECQK